jgi:hypothetical protein
MVLQRTTKLTTHDPDIQCLIFCHVQELRVIPYEIQSIKILLRIQAVTIPNVTFYLINYFLSLSFVVGICVEDVTTHIKSECMFSIIFCDVTS